MCHQVVILNCLVLNIVHIVDVNSAQFAPHCQCIPLNTYTCKTEVFFLHITDLHFADIPLVNTIICDCIYFVWVVLVKCHIGYGLVC